MSSVENLREFVNERLTAAAEEIFRVFKTTIVEYEEEIDRQRKLLDIVWRPEIKLHRIEIPQQHVCKEEEVLTGQQLSNQDCNSSLNQKEPEPPQIKEEQEEPCTGQEGEQHETHTFMLTSSNEESDQREPGPKSDHQPLSHNSHVPESQAQEGSKRGDSESTRDAELQPKKRHHKSRSRTKRANNLALSEIWHKTDTGKKSLQSDMCDKASKCESKLQSDMKIPTGVKPYLCNTCGKSFSFKSSLKNHTRYHTGERLITCTVCEKRFTSKSVFEAHIRFHKGEKPYLCNTCGKRFSQSRGLKNHIRLHTGEKPFACTICEKKFTTTSGLKGHTRFHTGEKPYPCKTCGKRFSQNQPLKEHERIHTGERPYPCTTCGKAFRCRSHIKQHMKIHTG